MKKSKDDIKTDARGVMISRGQASDIGETQQPALNAIASARYLAAAQRLADRQRATSRKPTKKK